MKNLISIVMAVFALTCIAASCEQKAPHNGGTGGSYSTGGDSATGGEISSGGSTDTGGQTSTGGFSTTGGATAAPTTLSQCQRVCAQYQRFNCPEDTASCEAQCVLHTTDIRFSPTQAAAEKYISCRIQAQSKAQLQNCGLASCR